MVRLEAANKYKKEQRFKRISIPLWCDWKNLANAISAVGKGFQFHYGAIGSKFQKLAFGQYPHFNSTMVRLEAINPYSSSWVDRFQFHYGAIGSLLNSITHEAIQKFQFHYGAIGSRTC